MKQFYVYIFFDPRDGEPFYVGKGFGWRYKRHLTLKGPNKHLRNRIKAIRSLGLEPIIEKTNTIDEQEALQKEVEFIRIFGRRDLGTGTLCNYTDGGEGSTGRQGFSHTVESRAKISASLKGQIISEETRAKISAARKGSKVIQSAQTREKIRIAQSTPEFRKQLSERAKRTVTPERLTYMTELARQKNIGIKRSKEHRKKISEAQKGRRPSEESRFRMSLAQYLRQARERGEHVGN